MEPTVGIKALRAAMLSAATAKLDLDALRATRDPRRRSRRPRRALFARRVGRALERHRAARWDPGIGLHAVAALPLGHWDVIDYLAGSSETLGEASASCPADGFYKAFRRWTRQAPGAYRAGAARRSE